MAVHGMDDQKNLRYHNDSHIYGSFMKATLLRNNNNIIHKDILLTGI